MNSSELQALRRLLFFSVAEAARYLAADDERPRGVEDRTWNRWESGRMPIPDNIADAVMRAVQWREQAFDQAQSALRDARAADGPEDALVVIWYDELDDWPEPPILWRPHQSALAALLADAPAAHLVRLVRFDARAYNLWRKQSNTADGQVARVTWAALQDPDAPPGGFLGA